MRMSPHRLALVVAHAALLALPIATSAAPALDSPQPVAPPSATAAPTQAPADAATPPPDGDAGAAKSRWTLSLQGWGGLQRYDVLGLPHAVDTTGLDLLHGNVRALGVSLLVRYRWFDLGFLYEGSILRPQTDTAIFTPLIGARLRIAENVRFDLLGELGGHQFVGVGLSDGVTATEAKTVWVPFVGLRPTLTFTAPIGWLRASFSAVPFARWDLVKKDVQVVGSTVETWSVGGTAYGIAVGVGVEI
jgi:hypothetical protein